MGRVFRYVIGGAVALFLTSCSTVYTVGTWRSPGGGPNRYGKVMVASLARDGETRRIYEDVVVGEFVRRGINAVPSYRAVDGKGSPNRQALLETARKVGAEALLTIQTTQIERHSDVQPGYTTGYPGYYSPRFGPDWGWYGGGYGGYGYGGYGYGGYGYGGYGYGGYGGYSPWGATTFYQPPTVVTYDVATIQTNLFSGDGKMVWAATMETLEPGRVVKVAKDLAETLTESLGKEGLL